MDARDAFFTKTGKSLAHLTKTTKGLGQRDFSSSFYKHYAGARKPIAVVHRRKPYAIADPIHLCHLQARHSHALSQALRHHKPYVVVALMAASIASSTIIAAFLHCSFSSSSSLV
ncbi:hypothetical protein KSP39_PZI018820 [Platanthera zijinensis]|uniref:Uncharacterized protein n=1 Tax=Platanthera zijinensis TaxID=2320716 RepID=A0AAP0FZ01_9ASPA